MSYLSPDEIAEATSGNSSFSRQLPGLQLAWDSTSLGTFKECPYKYYLSHIIGWTPRSESVHLTFGLHYHAALERYDHAKAAGADHEEAMRVAVRYALVSTWNSELKRPWISDHPSKNRLTLVRSIVWYLDQFKDDPIKTLILENGKPAVELSFRFELSYKTAFSNETFLMCGHLDKLAEFPGYGLCIADKKTSTSTISPEFFRKFSPDNQMSTYGFAGKVVYHAPVKGIIIDAAQIAVTFTRFTRGFVDRPEPVLAEWYEDLGQWLFLAEQYATQNRWPKNDKSCNAYGGCPFRDICGKSPSIREDWLKADFVKRTWDPLIARGDI